MNNRIREIFNEAGRYAYEQNPGENSYGRPVDENKYEEDRYTKFAELIVRECAMFLDQKTEVDDDGTVVDAPLASEMLEHFGVEE